MAGKKEKVVMPGDTAVKPLTGKTVKEFVLKHPIDDFGKPLRKLSELPGGEAKYTVAIAGGVAIPVPVIAVRTTGRDVVFIPMDNVASFTLSPLDD